MTKLRVTSVSARASEVEDIILRQSDTCRLLLRPMLVDNQSDAEACVRGYLIYQVKDDEGNYKEDNNILDLRRVRKGECVKIELKSEDVSNLLINFDMLKSLYKQHGLSFGETSYHIYDGNLDEVVQQLSNFGDVSRLLESLNKLQTEDISKLSLVVSLSKIDKLLLIWQENETNPKEGFWQSVFKENSWILSQIFACPHLYIDDQPYLGGKSGHNSGGVYSDFLLKQTSSANVAFVEIKTPMTPIMNSSLLRGTSDSDTNAIYANSFELSGAINQSLNQRDTFLENKIALKGEFSNYRNPKCVVIIGNKSSLTEGRLRNFDSFRHNLQDIEILTYDEIFDRIQMLKDCFLVDPG